MVFKRRNINLSSLFKLKYKSETCTPAIEYDFHKQSLEALAQNFSTSLTDGLDNDSAKNLLTTNGRNLISPKKKNILCKALSYLFTGFCGLLWIAAIICILGIIFVGLS